MKSLLISFAGGLLLYALCRDSGWAVLPSALCTIALILFLRLVFKDTA